MMFNLVDAQGFSSEVQEVAFAMPTALATDAVCDPNNVFEACPSDTVCFDRDQSGTTKCLAASAPVLSSVEAFYNTVNPAIAITVSGTDVDNDVKTFLVTFVDDQGNDLVVQTDFFGNPITEVELEFNLTQANGSYTGSFSSGWPVEAGVPASVRVTAADLSGLLSDEQVATVGATPMVNAGDACDYNRGLNTCPVNFYCIGPDAFSPDVASVCSEIQAPTVTSASSWWDQATGKFSVWAEGTDADNNTVGLQVQGYNAQNQPVLGTIALAFTSTEAQAGAFKGIIEGTTDVLADTVCTEASNTAIDNCLSTSDDFFACISEGDTAYQTCVTEQRAVINTITYFEVIAWMQLKQRAHQ